MRVPPKPSQSWLAFLFPILLAFTVRADPQGAEITAPPNPIVLGQSAAVTGASSGLGIELWLGAQTYFDQLNKEGGIKGRQVKVVILDDGYQPDQALLNTINLITKRKVFGLFGYVGTPTLVRSLPVIQRYSQDGTFLFSNFTGAQPQREMPYQPFIFNVRASYNEETQTLVDYFIANGHKKIGVFIQDDSYGRSGAAGVEKALQKIGMTTALEVTYHKGTKFDESLTEQAQLLKDHNVDAVIAIGAYAACAGFIRDARKIGLTAPVANVSFVGSLALLKLLKKAAETGIPTALDDVIVSQVVPTFDNLSVPLVKEFRLAVDQTNPIPPAGLFDSAYVPEKYSFSKLEGYLNAKILTEIMKSIPAEITPKAFVKAAESMAEINVGLPETVKFTHENHQALHKVYLTKIKDGHFVETTNALPTRAEK